MAILNKKIKAATLIESLIAMVIVMLCFGISTTVYINVISSGNQIQKLKSELILKKVAMETKKEHLFLDEEITLDEITVRKKITPYNGLKNLSQINLQAYNSNEKLLSEYNELVSNQ
jgi:hypothetical protein